MLTDETYSEHLRDAFATATEDLDTPAELLRDVRRALRRSHHRKVALLATLPALAIGATVLTVTTMTGSDHAGVQLAKLAAAAPRGVHVQELPSLSPDRPFGRVADLQPGTLRGRMMDTAPEPLGAGTTETVDIDGYPAVLQQDAGRDLVQLDITLSGASGPRHLVLQAHGVARDDVLRMARAALTHR
jgi:hypothetical protein